MPFDFQPRPLDDFPEIDRPWIEALRSGEQALRETALYEVSDVVDDLLAEELLRFAYDPQADAEERGQALIALGPSLELCAEEEEIGTVIPGMEDPMAPLGIETFERVRGCLRRLYLDADVPTVVRRKALEAAVRAPEPWLRDAVEAAWSSGDPDWRVTALFCLGLLREDDGRIRESLDSDELGLRREAIRAVGSAGIATLGPRILAIAADRFGHRELRLTAVEALAELQPEGAEEVLSRIMGESDEELAMAAEEAREEILVFAGHLALMEDLDDDDDFDDDGF